MDGYKNWGTPKKIWKNGMRKDERYISNVYVVFVTYSSEHLLSTEHFKTIANTTASAVKYRKSKNSGQ